MKTAPWVLITGGAKRLGKEFCLAFAKAGWNVLCHHHTSRAEAEATQRMVREMGVACELVALDLSDSNASETLLDGSLQAAGELPRCIVNCASIFDADDALTSSEASMQRHFQLNTVVPLALGNALASRLKNQPATPGQHSVIHVLDQKVHNLNPDYFSYTVSKLALERSVALQAQALAPKVRVCGLSPGLLYLSGPQTPENFDQASKVNLLRQTIQPADVAASAVFIAENISLNGCTLISDNGQHLVPLSRDVMFAIETGDTP